MSKMSLLAATALLCLILGTRTASAVVSASSPPPRPPPPTPPPPAPSGGLSTIDYTKGCPTDPLQYCDFFITGYRTVLPSITVGTTAAGNDKQLSGLLRDRFHNDSDPKGIIEVDRSGNAHFMCPQPSGTTASTGIHSTYSSNTFYSTNNNNQAYISSHNVDQYGNELQVRCVVLELPVTQVHMDPLGTAPLTNLNPGDGNLFYPENRRCVVFSTTPGIPACLTCPAAIPNGPSKDLFPLSTTDKAILAQNCSTSTYPANSHACPISGACSFSNVTCPTAIGPDSSGFFGQNTATYGCGKTVHVQLSKTVVSACSQSTVTRSASNPQSYYCYSSAATPQTCLALCKGQSWCTGWVLAVPNYDGENNNCKKNIGPGSGWVTQAGCSPDIVTPYYGGCGWCFLMDKDYCGPACNDYGLNSSTAASGNDVYWATYGRVKCPYGKNDPHFVGADGTRFEFNGLPDQSFCLLSDERVHINMKMHGYFDDRLVGASVLKNGKAVRTWMRELGFVWKKEDAEGVLKTHRLHLVARKGPQQERGEGFLAKATIDGQPIARLEEGASYEDGSGVKLTFGGVEKYGPYDMDKYHLSIDGLLEIDLKLRVAHPLLQTPQDAEAHFNIMFDSVTTSPKVHGIIGQTYKSGRMARSLEYRALSALLGHPVAADGESGLGYLDGTTADYVSSSVLAPDCKFSSFEQ